MSEPVHGTRCAHCLLEVPEESATRETIDGKETIFCCPGCRAIHGLLCSEGLSGFYTRRKGWTPGPPETARVPIDAFDGAVRTDGGEDAADLLVSGIRCASCVWLIERYLEGRPGIRSVRVNFATGRARVAWTHGAIGIGDVVLAIRALGYAPYPPESLPAGDALRREKSDLLLRFGTAAFLSMQVMLFTAGLYAGYFQGIDARYAQLFRWLCFLLSTPVVFYSGAPFFRGALRGARHGAFGMDALVFLGAFSAYGYSTASLFLGGDVYFDTATMILTLILLGRYIEAGARARAADGISRLVRLAPVMARKAVPGGGTADVPVASLSPGDLVEVVPGERMPVDGNVAEGGSEADEALLSGESAPVPKAAGDPVVAGSLNGTGRLLVRVARTGADTVLSRIVQAVEEAQARKAPIQRLADRVVRFFVPAILLIAAGTVFFRIYGGSPAHAALMAGISVLVIACPCALGLATPLAVLVGTTSAQARGILVRGGDVLEQAAKVRCVLFDKTGTLTLGRPRLSHVEGIGIGREDALRLAASLEASSEHAIGRAIAEAFPAARRLPVRGFRAHPGEGIEGEIDGVPYLLGRPELLERFGVAVDGEATRAYTALSAARRTTVLLSDRSRPLAIFATEDALRPEAAEAVSLLRAAGTAVAMVTGDDPGVAARVAGEVGIGDIRARVTPEGKREEVRRARERFGPVLVVGDGVNDAPALAEADVGVAMGRGTGLAIHSAGATLMTEDLLRVPAFLALSRATMRVIRQNLFWAFSYNLAAIPLAVAGKLHPIIAAAFMAGSSLLVVGNSLRLRKGGK
ncbi:MAG: heavy metal translocating P-type ATPase [Deltaproteobacteria bacterium]|nr:heavy metal translocating P-type ATPase [Deltaproteobacteria bacterium]